MGKTQPGLTGLARSRSVHLAAGSQKLHCCNSMAKLWSRNTKVENTYDVSMTVDVIQGPGNVLVTRFELPPGQFKYLCYEDLSCRYNPDRSVIVEVYLTEQRERGVSRIGTSVIRDNKKVVLNVSSDRITPTSTRGHFAGRLGLIIKLNKFLKILSAKLKC